MTQKLELRTKNHGPEALIKFIVYDAETKTMGLKPTKIGCVDRVNDSQLVKTKIIYSSNDMSQSCQGHQMSQSDSKSV